MSSSWFGKQQFDADGMRTIHETSEWTQSASLLLGSIEHLNGMQRGVSGPFLMRLTLPDFPDSAPINTFCLQWQSNKSVTYELMDTEGSVVESGAIELRDVFPGMVLGPALQRAARRHFSLSATDSIGPIVPLFCVSSQTARTPGWTLHRDVHFYSQVRFTPEDALFIRTSSQPYVHLIGSADLGRRLELAPARGSVWFEEAMNLHRANALFLNNHQAYYRKCFEGTEIEVKFDLQPPLDIWSLTVECYRRLRTGLMPGYIGEYRDEFQQWDYVSHMYEIIGPAEEVGYISFIPTTDGRCTVKRKRFSQDQLCRSERMIKGVEVRGSYEDYLRQEPRLSWRRLPSYRRVRYDVNLESIRSGHVYGIFFDHCSLVDADDSFRCLNQCEVEYLRSRVAVDLRDGLVMEELQEIVTWTRDFLRSSEIRFVEGYYSKLSFLRECAAEVSTNEAIRDGVSAPL